MCPAKGPKTTASPPCKRPCEALREARAEIESLTAELVAAKQDCGRMRTDLAAARGTIGSLEALLDEQSKRAKTLQEQQIGRAHV